MQLERFLASSRVELLGAGLLVRPDKAPPGFGELLGSLLADSQFARAARMDEILHG